jgi:hypothetical protein
MRELIESGELSEIDADIWLTSMAFTAQPSSDMIREISPLLRRPAPSKKMFLTISTLVNSYCRQADDCEYNRDIQQVRGTMDTFFSSFLATPITNHPSTHLLN